MIYFTSDLHFFHSGILKLTTRPFSNVQEMNQILINNWNNTVSKNDEIYILGDLALKASVNDINSLVQQLNGKKNLIVGNHDHFLKNKEFDRSQFNMIKDYHILKYNNVKYILFHYPILEWEAFYKGSVHLYGHLHTHSIEKRNLDYNVVGLLGKRAYNVNVEFNDYCPISIDEINKKVFCD